jgi:hypothetical protein
LNIPATFVNKTMMEVTKGDQISQFGFATVRPVLDMMPVGVAVVAAAGEAATLISGIKSTFERGRNAPGFSPNVERIALVIFCYVDEATITSQTTARFSRHGRAIFRFTLASFLTSKSFLRNVDDDLVFVTAAHRFGPMSEKAFGHKSQCIGATST